MTNKVDELRLSLYVHLFEMGKELSRKYEKYDGDLDWLGWLEETLPKIPLLNHELDILITQEKTALLERVERHIGDLHMERIGVPDIDTCTPAVEAERRRFSQALQQIKDEL